MVVTRNTSTLGEQVFDVAIIGGGILGAGIARDAALRGLSVALVEKNDFASGTSSASTKLIHGGLRYLEQFAFGLVAESCRERRLLLDTASHLVQPLPLLMPVYAGDPHSLFKLRIGTTLYDWMTVPRHPRMPRHSTLSPAEAAALEPTLPMKGPDGGALRGAVLVYDCQMDDARLCIETILDAERHGAVCFNYCQAGAIQLNSNRVESLRVVDTLNQDEVELKARVFINATGPWAEQTSSVNGSNPAIRLSPTKGAHLVIPRLQQKHGIYFQSDGDGRMIFLVPWDDASLLGTTDTDFSGDPGDARADTDDVDYLLNQLGSIMPDSGIGRDDVITSFAGVRALVQSDSRRPSSRSREEKVAVQGDNLLHVAGGKYTTFRAVAEKVLRSAGGMLNQRLENCRTADSPLPNLRPTPSGQQLAPSPAVFESDILHACKAEKAVTLADVMRRRTRLALSAHGGAEVAETVSHLMMAALDWEESRRRREVESYLQARNQHAVHHSCDSTTNDQHTSGGTPT